MSYTTPTVSQVAAALGAAVSGVTTPQGQTMRYLPYLSDSFTPPIVLVAIDTVKYHMAMGSSDSRQSYTLHLILPRTDDRSALAQMEAYMSPTGTSSILLAVESSTSLGGVIQDVIVTDSGPPTAVEINNNPYIGLPFKVEVIA